MTGRDIRVVIADDHPVVRDGLSALLASVPSMVVAGVAATGREAVQAAVTLRPDVLVMDIQMPELTGIAAAGEITRLVQDVAVLMLTMFDDDDSVFAAMRAGARGYVLKGAQQDEIVRAIQSVAAGEAIFGPGIARRVLGLVSAPQPADVPFEALTSREREVLDLIAAGVGNTEIARRMSIAPKTVASHVSAIFSKLQVADRSQAIALQPAQLKDLTARELDVLRLVARGLANAEIAAELVVEESTIKTHVSRILLKLGLRDRVQAVVIAYEVGFIRPDDPA